MLGYVNSLDEIRLSVTVKINASADFGDETFVDPSK